LAFLRESHGSFIAEARIWLLRHKQATSLSEMNVKAARPPSIIMGENTTRPSIAEPVYT
jgi:hypothetical protein